MMKKNLLCTILKGILVFFYIYSTPILFLPPALTSIRIVTLIAALFAIILLSGSKAGLFRSIKVSPWFREYRKLLKLHVFLFVYILILLVSIGRGDGAHMFEQLINMFLCSFLPILLFIILFDGFDDFANALIVANLLQTIIIWICLLVPPIGLVIDTIFVMPEKLTEYRLEYAGGLGCITAPGVIRYSMGFVAVFYKMLRNGRIWDYLLYILMAVTISMIARTGLFISIFGVMLLLLFLHKNKKKTRSVWSLIIVAAFAMLTLHFVLDDAKMLSFFDERFARMTQMFEIGMHDAFFGSYYDGTDTVIPDISIETIFGTGIISGKSANGIVINADGGFFKLYSGLGLVLSIWVHLWFFLKFYKMSKRISSNIIRMAMYFFLGILIMGEFKEWIIYDMYAVCIFYVLTYFAYREQNNYKTNQIFNYD